MTDDQILLASAYLDGDLDGPERARAEADPEVMAEVARLREARALLRAVEAPDPARREQAITAALRTRAGQQPAAPVVPLSTRRPWWTAAGVAAAVLALAVAGIVVGGRIGGDDDDSASVSSATAGASTQDRNAAAPAPAAASATTAAGSATTAAASGTAAAEATSGGTTAAATSGAAPAATTPIQLDSPAALATFAATTSSLQQATAAGVDTCGGGRYIGRANYGPGHVAVEVFVVGTDAVALDATSCAEVARAPLP
jgi:hypothetical protein